MTTSPANPHASPRADAERQDRLIQLGGGAVRWATRVRSVRRAGSLTFPRLAGWTSPSSRMLAKQALLAVVIVLLPLVIFTYRLEQNPPGFFIDEAIYGYEAHTLLRTGGYSSIGEFLPRMFAQQGSVIRNHGLYTYLVVPFIAALGTNEVAVRLPSVCTAVLLLGILYLLLGRNVAGVAMLVAALWWPVTSWVFLVARFGVELMATALICTVLIALLVRIQGSPRIRVADVVLFDIAAVCLFFIYASGVVQAVAFVALGILILGSRRAPLRWIGAMLLAIVGMALLSVPYLLDGSLFFRGDQAMACLQQARTCLLSSLASHFAYTSYFGNSYYPHEFPVVTHSITGTSLIPRPLAPFLVIGLVELLIGLVRRRGLALVTLAAALIAIAPSAVLLRGFDSYRTVALLPVIFIAIILGLDASVRARKRLPPWTWTPALGVLILATVWFGRGELQKDLAYEYNVDAALYTGFQYGYQDAFDYVARVYQQYDHIVVTRTVAYVPERYIEFFDPDHRYSKIQIGPLDFDADQTRTLWVARPDEVYLGCLRVRHVVYYPDQWHVAFYVGDPVC